ncbi:hypothetical protein ABEB36_012356 [Hypothenemus hampei]|uniref:Carboxylic ester hydrolase n=1 Tax=Hypothenemus hampei TaxID=57062 RepID=A0ABD1EB30_HYPHA
MVWFYGGTFFSGSSKYKLYAPDYLLEKNVVFVSFNYRLGVFGFLSTEDLEAPGNWGLKDQILALKWVKDNIEKFGGDPTRVTIFGESAGAASVSYLTHSPLAQGLFSGIIAQSGSSLCLWSLSHNARMKAFNVGIQMGFISLSSKALIKFLRSVDYKKLKLAESNVTLQAFLGGNILAGLPFAVVKEPNHPGAVFSSRTWQQLESGNFSRVPMIVGFNSNEGAALSSYIDLIRPVMVQYDLDLTRLVPHDLTRNPLKRIPAAFEVRRNFFNLSPIALQDQSLGRYITVDQFERPIREFVIQTSKYTKVFYYQFSYKGILGDPNNAQQGVGHAEELNYLFVKDRNATANDLRTVDRFTTLWTNFAKNGNPTPLSSSNTSLGLLNWESNDPNTNATASIKYLNIDLNINMSVNPFQDDWIFYQKLYATYGDPPYATY